MRLRARTRVRVALWIATTLLGVVLAVSADRRGMSVVIAILLTLLVGLTAWVDHLIAIRENRR